MCINNFLTSLVKSWLYVFSSAPFFPQWMLFSLWIYYVKYSKGRLLFFICKIVTVAKVTLFGLPVKSMGQACSVIYLGFSHGFLLPVLILLCWDLDGKIEAGKSCCHSFFMLWRKDTHANPSAGATAHTWLRLMNSRKRIFHYDFNPQFPSADVDIARISSKLSIIRKLIDCSK